ALAMMHSTGTVFHGAELHRLLGEFLLRQGTVETAGREAEACFHRALTMAREQRAKSLELRAAMSLTRLYQQQGRQAEARPVLAGVLHLVHGRFRSRGPEGSRPPPKGVFWGGPFVSHASKTVLGRFSFFLAPRRVGDVAGVAPEPTHPFPAGQLIG